MVICQLLKFHNEVVKLLTFEQACEFTASIRDVGVSTLPESFDYISQRSERSIDGFALCYVSSLSSCVLTSSILSLSFPVKLLFSDPARSTSCT